MTFLGKDRTRASAWLGVHGKKIQRFYFFLYSTVYTRCTNNLRIYIAMILALLFFCILSHTKMCFLLLDSMHICIFKIKMESDTTLNSNYT